MLLFNNNNKIVELNIIIGGGGIECRLAVLNKILKSIKFNNNS